ncbi:unnamed protein product [Amoebophrya sp. A25]|nr:unnamed protein product [Amoebophrya sp. A25]|eukprot:GSA25T00015171001.1
MGRRGSTPAPPEYQEDEGAQGAGSGRLRRRSNNMSGLRHEDDDDITEFSSSSDGSENTSEDDVEFRRRLEAKKGKGKGKLPRRKTADDGTSPSCLGRADEDGNPSETSNFCTREGEDEIDDAPADRNVEVCTWEEQAEVARTFHKPERGRAGPSYSARWTKVGNSVSTLTADVPAATSKSSATYKNAAPREETFDQHGEAPGVVGPSSVLPSRRTRRGEDALGCGKIAESRAVVCHAGETRDDQNFREHSDRCRRKGHAVAKLEAQPSLSRRMKNHDAATCSLTSKRGRSDRQREGFLEDDSWNQHQEQVQASRACDLEQTIRVGKKKSSSPPPDYHMEEDETPLERYSQSPTWLNRSRCDEGEFDRAASEQSPRPARFCRLPLIGGPAMRG